MESSLPAESTHHLDDTVRVLAAHNDRLRALIEGMADGFVLQDRDGAIQVLNPAAERILGLSAAQLSGRTSFDPLWRSVRRDGSPFEGADHPAMVALRTGVPQLGIVMGVHSGGRGTTWILIDAHPVFDDGSREPSRVVVTFRDITAQKRDQDELGRHRILLSSVLENLPAGYYVFDESDGRVLAFNALFCSIWGLEDRAAELRDGSLGHTEMLERMRSHLVEAASLDDGAQASGELERVDVGTRDMLTRDGRTIRRLSKRLKDEFGAPIGRLFLFEDVTREIQSEEERRTLERRMAEVRKLESLGVLAGGIAHDFNNLLTSIVGSAEMAAQEAVEHSPLRRQMERVIEAADRATELCRRMLNYAGADNAPVRRVHMSDLAHAALRWLQPQITTRTRLVENLAEDLPSVLGDPDQLNQVVVNLVANACEALPDGEGTVRITTGSARRERGFFAQATFAFDLPAGEYVHLEVTDDGRGIDAAVLNRVFDPFFSTKVVGRGLGLSAVLGIVRSHRGAIQVESRIGVGTTMRIFLPRRVGVDVTRSSVDRSPPPGQRVVERLPVHHIGDPPPFDGALWSLSLTGAVARPWSLDLAEIVRVSTVDIEADFHAGCGWTVRGVRWRGARLADLLDRAMPTSDAHFVRFFDGASYDTSLSIDDARAPDVLLATMQDGRPLEALHGGPLRLVVPAKYGRKSVKWLRAIQVILDDVPGYWERRGFHSHADPWSEERTA